MKAYIYSVPKGGSSEDFAAMCEREVQDAGLTLVTRPYEADVAIAPHLVRKLSASEVSSPKHGVVIFHPSALPLHRGPDAVKWSVHLGERVTAATWFKAAGGLDDGDICASEAVVLSPGESAGRSYHTRIVPTAVRALRLVLCHLMHYGELPLAAQDESLATYESWLRPQPHPAELMGP